MLDIQESIIIDFDGVRCMNSSFSNALFANLAKRYSKSILSMLKFKNVRVNVKNEILSSLSFGLKTTFEV